MAISRKIVAQDDSEVNQWLKIDHASRYIVNDSPEWQFLFGIDSILNASNQIIKIAAKFNEDTFADIKLSAYLFDQQNSSVGNASTCTFNIYKVDTTSTWTEVLITQLNGVQLSNNYFYVNPTTSSLSIDFFGGDTIMVEVVITRLSTIYRDRVYINHLGIYDNVTRVRRQVDLLDILKKDE